MKIFPSWLQQATEYSGLGKGQHRFQVPSQKFKPRLCF